MADITYFTLKQGASGAGFRVTLKDKFQPVDLSDAEWVKFYAKRAGRGVAINGVACTVIPDQVVFRGVIEYDFDDTTAAIPTGEYDVEFHVKDADGIHIYPTSKTEPYGKLIVLPNAD